MNTFKKGDRVKFTEPGSTEYLGTVIAEHERDISEVRWDDGEESSHFARSLTHFPRSRTRHEQ